MKLELIRSIYLDTVRVLPEKYKELSLRDIERNIYQISQVFKEEGNLLDLGGGLSAVPLVLRRLGMHVTVVDAYKAPYYNSPESNELKEIFTKESIDLVEAVLPNYIIPFSEESLDVVTSFDSMEHWHHSPKALFEKSVSALVPGGKFILGVPNSLNLIKRIRVIRGITNLHPFDSFYFDGNPFWGHVREMAVYELYKLAEWLCLVDISIIGRNWYGFNNYSNILKPILIIIDSLLKKSLPFAQIFILWEANLINGHMKCAECTRKVFLSTFV